MRNICAVFIRLASLRAWLCCLPLLLLANCDIKRAFSPALAPEDPKDSDVYEGPHLVVVGSPNINFGNADLGFGFEWHVVLKNTGTSTAINMSGSSVGAPFYYAGGAYPGTGGDCGSSLEAGDTCSLYLDFIPSVHGVFQDSLFVVCSKTLCLWVIPTQSIFPTLSQ
jgi:hypothetical protein